MMMILRRPPSTVDRGRPTPQRPVSQARDQTPPQSRLTMEVHKVFTSATRTVSATSLRERLSSLSSLMATPLKPVANLHAQIEFVPSKIPRKRRLQTMMVPIWSTAIVWCTFVFLFPLSFPPLWPFLAAYLVWIVYVDKGLRRADG
ncbi:hypothetical protein LXA43DRAFT_1028888 [Ganoderma leucocontextum]|nr:hypothetical protein LXA43DRAFT_1028888 [Ganoderma leucocontextum]